MAQSSDFAKSAGLVPFWRKRCVAKMVHVSTTLRAAEHQLQSLHSNVSAIENTDVLPFFYKLSLSSGLTCISVLMTVERDGPRR